MVTGYCVKCKKKKTMSGAKKAKVGKKNAMKGKCPTCGTTMFTFVASAAKKAPAKKKSTTKKKKSTKKRRKK
jgi:predicted  nucleic acid-binding Zn-ribbon protein